MLFLLQSVLILTLWIGTVHGCVDNYLIFEEQTFSNNSENRLMLYQAFYPPNAHLPYSVVVTYQTNFPNGTKVNISTNPSCPYSQVWIWLSSPVFLYQEPSSLNRHTLFTLNYFEEWIPPHVIITVPYPCQDQAEGFMQRTTTSLQSYAVGERTGGRFKGNVANACGENSFVFISENLSIVAGAGFILLGLFVLSAVPVIFQRNRHLRALASNEMVYSFESFGLFWGVSTTLFVCTVSIIYSDLRFLIKIFHNLGEPMQVVWLLCIILLALCTTFAALFIALRSTFTVPHLFLFLAKVCCCRNKESHARKFVTFFAVWFDMLALQFLCHHGVVAVLAIPAAPMTIVTNMLLIGLTGTCLSHTFALMFTLSAKVPNLCGSHDQNWEELLTCWKKNECSYFFRAGILIPFLLAIGLFSVLLAFSGKYINSATEQNNFPSFLLSVFIPLLLTVLGVSLQLFISKWLKNDELPQEEQLIIDHMSKWLQNDLRRRWLKNYHRSRRLKNYHRRW